jgi:hypothetical protein
MAPNIGSGATLAPPPVPGYSLWLYAPGVGNNDTEWLDLSGNGNNATTYTGSPTLVPGAVNGMAAYLFNNGNPDSFRTTNYDRPSSTTIFVVAAPTSYWQSIMVGATDGLYTLGYNGQEGIAALYSCDGYANMIGGGQDFNSGPFVLGGRTDASATYGVSQTLTFNGTITSWGVFGVPSDDPSVPRQIGNAPANWPYNGYLCVVLEYPFALTDTQMQLVSSYLASQWAVSSYPWQAFNATVSESQCISFDSGSDTVSAYGQPGPTQYNAATGAALGVQTLDITETGTQLVSDGTSIWCAGSAGDLYQVNISTYALTNSFAGLDCIPQCFDGTYIWSASGTSGLTYVTKTDTSGSVIGQYDLGYLVATGGTGGILFDGTYIWAISNTNSIDSANVLIQVDQSSGAVLNTYSFSPHKPGSLTFDGTYLWMGFADVPTIVQVDPSDGSVLSTYDFSAYSTLGPNVAGFGQFQCLVFDGTNIRGGGFYGLVVVLSTSGAVLQISNAAPGLSGAEIYGMCFAPPYNWVASLPNSSISFFI